MACQKKQTNEKCQISIRKKNILANQNIDMSQNVTESVESHKELQNPEFNDLEKKIKNWKQIFGNFRFKLNKTFLN